MLLWPVGHMGEAWEPSKNQCSFRNGVHWTETYFHAQFKPQQRRHVYQANVRFYLSNTFIQLYGGRLQTGNSSGGHVIGLVPGLTGGCVPSVLSVRHWALYCPPTTTAASVKSIQWTGCQAARSIHTSREMQHSFGRSKIHSSWPKSSVEP